MNTTTVEQKRLLDLAATGIMDSLPEQAYDDIATLASYICECPMAYISFIDDAKQWYKTRINVPFSETSLEEALCANILEENSLVHVPDLQKDERFSSNAFVKAKNGIRFYAGYPLRTSEGSTLGTLCVIDYKTRVLTKEQQFALEALGRQVVSLLELRKILNTSQKLALHDSLTGLPNRLLINEQILQACREAKRENVSCAVLFIDLDHFKIVNDTHGHEVGDRVLKETGKILKRTIREEDIVGRLGGDEFVVILKGITTLQDVERVAIAIRKAFSKPLKIDGIFPQIGASIGISLYPDHGHDHEKLLSKADLALYTVKNSEKGRYAFFSETLLS